MRGVAISAGSLVVGLMGGIMLIGASVMVWVLVRWAAEGQLENNPVAGIRTSATTASPEAWVAAHRAALPWARGLGVFGIVVGLLLVATAFLPAGPDPEAPHALVLTTFAVGYGGLLLGCIPLVRKASSAARRVSSQPR